jgi:hypothetical protein
MVSFAACMVASLSRRPTYGAPIYSETAFGAFSIYIYFFLLPVIIVSTVIAKPKIHTL